MKVLAWFFLLLLAVTVSAFGQLVFSVPNQQSGGFRILQQPTAGGQVSQINVGLAEANYASLSRNGRFITFSSPDPTEPVSQILPSSDIYQFDRVTGQTRRVLNQQSMLLLGPQGQIETFTEIPEFNALSPNGSLVAFSNRITRRTGTADPRRTNNLNLVDVNVGIPVTVEEGNGQAFDLLSSEFIGISWAPDANSFLTSGYVFVNGPIGQRPVQGIVRFARNGSGQFVRVPGALSNPRYTTNGVGFSAGIQIFPAISPSGSGLAYFDIEFPDSALLQAPATARLIVANADGSGATERVIFNPGFYPLGLTWSADGNQLVFSIANQQQQGGFFAAAGEPTTAAVRVAPSFGSTTTPTQLPGIDGGFLPNLPFSGGVVVIPSGDLSQARLSLTRSGEGLLFRATGLEPNASYILESSTDLSGAFSNQSFLTGSTLMTGVSIPNQGRKFFRLRIPPN
jgi:hypothetical protein